MKSKNEKQTRKADKDKQTALISVRVSEDIKKFFDIGANKEKRPISNFLMSSTLTYMKEHLGMDYDTWEGGDGT